MKTSYTWLRAAGVRALKTVCQTAVATIGTAAVMSEVNWTAVLSASLLAGVLSLLTSAAGLPELEGTGHSCTNDGNMSDVPEVNDHADP